MAQQIIDDSIWKERIPAAVRYKKKWETLFKCEHLENYYEGRQWKDAGDYNPYVINKFFETIQIKIAKFIPTFPVFNVTAKPANSDYNLEFASTSSQLKQDVLNSIVEDNKLHFAKEMELAYKDHFFRFGVVEVGYASDWIINPNAPKPLLNTDVDASNRGQKPKVKKEPEELPVNERVFIKHIGAKRFHVGGIDHKYLDRCTWYGYYEWVHKEDLLALPLMNKDKVENAPIFMPDTETSDKDSAAHGTTNSLKIWHIWDTRAKVRLIILDSSYVTIYQRKFSRTTVFDYRPDARVKTEGFYPIPPSYNWISPQDELNETREQLRRHRRRFTRKFQVVEGTVDDPEVEKFESGQDGALIKVKKVDAITAIVDAPLGQSIDKAIVTSSDDFNGVSGTSAEQRGVADRTTATQANIINQRSGIRETSEQDRIVTWYQLIAREILLTVRDKFALGIWAKLSSDPGDFGEQFKESQKTYQWVTSEDLSDGYDFKIDVDLTSISADAQQDEKKKFMEFLAILTQFPAIAFSPLLVAEAAIRVGYRNQKVIAEFQKMALMQELGRQAQLQQAGINLPAPGPGGQQIAQQATPPDMEQLRQQTQNTIPGIQ